MKLVKSEEKISVMDERINKVLSLIAIGSMLTSFSLGTVAIINEIEKKKDSGRTIPVYNEVNYSNSYNYNKTGVVYISDVDLDENVNTTSDFDYTNVSFDSVSDTSDSFLFGIFFEQRPDLSFLYDEILKRLFNIKDELLALEDEIGNYTDEEKIEKEQDYSALLAKKDVLIEERDTLNNRRDEIVMMAIDYLSKMDTLKQKKSELSEIENTNRKLEKEMDNSSNAYYAKLFSDNGLKISNLEEEILQLENELYNFINESIGVEDVKFLWNGYNSAYGYVPAGEWDTWLNPNYAGEGHLTGLLGSFQGMQGTETGYDSRKGAEKLNYGDPDRALLKLLSQVTDSEGNLLYPIESFEKGGKYYYHIFGVNDDGTINYDLIDNPRFGLKMLGNFFIVGGDQRLLRERGSLVLTSLGPAIVIDNGKIPDLSIDPNHIDMSMDEVLFWLKNYSHNSDLIVNSMAGIYEWCTPEGFDGTIDVSYEIMERNYVNNLCELYDVSLICFFDRDEFFTDTTYDNQDDFVLKLNR